MEPKYNRIKELLREKRIDGVIVSSPENFHYIAGFAAHQHTVSRQPGMAYAVVDAREDVLPRIISMDFEIQAFKERKSPFIIKKYDTWVGVKTWSEITGEVNCQEPAARESSLDVLFASVREMALADKTVGIELSYLPADYWRLLCEKLPEAKFVNVSDLFVYARSVKTPEEIQVFRRLCDVVDKALTEVSKKIEVGVSERELAAVFRGCAIESGFCAPSSWSMFAAGLNGARLGLPGERRIARGDIVKFDGGVNAEFDFYTTDTSRSWIMEGADPLLYKLKDRLYAAQRKMISVAKPGLPMSKLFDAGYSYVKEAFPNYRRGHMGHSISMGPATAESPYISPEETRTLEPGMILAIEAPCYIKNIGGFNIEDMVLITENGAEILTPGAPHYL